MKTLEELKRDCGKFLSDNNIKPKSVMGHKLIYAFYVGAYAGMDQEAPAGVALSLMCGRSDELVRMP